MITGRKKKNFPWGGKIITVFPSLYLDDIWPRVWPHQIISSGALLHLANQLTLILILINETSVSPKDTKFRFTGMQSKHTIGKNSTEEDLCETFGSLKDTVTPCPLYLQALTAGLELKSWLLLNCGVWKVDIFHNDPRRWPPLLEREREALFIWELTERLNYIQTHRHTHSWCVLLLASFRLVDSDVTWLFVVNKNKWSCIQICVSYAIHTLLVVITPLNNHHCWWCIYISISIYI